jgi:hypothetical protein
MPTPFPIPAGYAQSSLHFTSGLLSEPEAVVTLGFDLVGQTLNQLNVSIVTHFTGTLISQLRDSFFFARCRSITATLEDEIAGSGQGTGATEAAVVDQCLLWKKTSGFRGRHNQGRNYWPGFLAENVISPNGLIDPTYLASINTLFDTWAGAILADGFLPVLLHKNGSTPTTVTNATFEKEIAVQRRRLGR